MVRRFRVFRPRDAAVYTPRAPTEGRIGSKSGLDPKSSIVGIRRAREECAIGLGFLDHMRMVPDHRISGMVTYPLDEILLATLAGVVCGADDW